MIEDLRADERDARQKLHEAEIMLKGARKHQATAQEQITYWKRTAGRDSDREPTTFDTVKSGGVPDLPINSPATDEQITELEGRVKELREIHAKARAELKKAVKNFKPSKPSKETGWETRKPVLINGVKYGAREPFDPDSLPVRKRDVLVDQKIIQKIGAR